MKHPTLYQLNTRILLNELGRSLGRPASLNDVSDAFLDQIAARGFAWVWPLGVWQTGPAGREISRTRPSLRDAFAHDLPDWQRNLLVDPQTSGGLLVSCAADRAQTILGTIQQAGYNAARIIGHTESGSPEVRVTA